AGYIQSRFSVPTKLIDTEISEGNTRPTAEFIHELLAKFGEEITQILGVDGINFLARKYGPELEGGEYLVVERPGSVLEAEVNPNKVHFLPTTSPVEISSTKIRNMIAAGDTDLKNM